MGGYYNPYASGFSAAHMAAAAAAAAAQQSGQMNSAMDALKYSGYMSAAGQGLSSLYSGSSSDPSTALKSMYSPSETGNLSGGGQDLGQTKTEYSADSLSRSYLEQQRAYYESAKGYGTDRTGLGMPTGYGESAKSYTPDSMSGRQSTESPDIKKGVSVTPDPGNQATTATSAQAFQSQQAALQAYYSQSMGMSLPQAASPASQPVGGTGSLSAAAGSSLPPLLPMAAQLSQYAGSGPAYPQGGAAGDYSRRPLSVLF